MTLPVIADVFRVAFEWKQTDDATLRATNVMHFHAPSKDPTDVAASITDNVNFAMWAHTSSHSEIFRFDVTPLDGSSLTVPFPVTDETNFKGSAGTGEVIPQVACIVKLLTNHRGRSYRGRVFLPWVVEEALDYGNIASSNVTTMNTAWVAFLAAMQADSVNLCVASYKLALYTNVAAVQVENLSGTIRKRQIR